MIPPEARSSFDEIRRIARNPGGRDVFIEILFQSVMAGDVMLLAAFLDPVSDQLIQ